MVKESTLPPEGDASAGQDWLLELVENASLTPKGQLVARYISANPRAASSESASELAERLSINSATVVRFAQALGFSGWPEFQLHLRHRYLGSLLPTDVLHTKRESGSRSHLQAAIERDLDNLHAALTTVDEAALTAIAEAVAGARRTLVVTSGSYSAAGVVLAHLGAVMGLPITLESRGGVHAVAASNGLEQGDCLLAISFWRQMRDATTVARACRERGVTVAAMTDSQFSPLAEIADPKVIVPTESASFFQSMTAPLSVVYALCAQLEELGGDPADQRIARAQELWAELDLFHRYDER